ncbi:MAG: hypothetical protein PHF46_01450 [Candidatus Gracilibacteria bacterium]|nr:hypothetical protein [Candidatus Gracilibacteria bacterium]MDD3120057.1 hypothetical protein [Candidatus Gracilibacteria bacterium]MDD4530242.1 hypothetical protein [Candidatus Gracilibacteria bacterium]
MKNFFLALIGNIFLLTNKVFAADVGIYGGISGADDVEKTIKLRTGNITFDDIPGMILYIINFLLGIVATIFMIMVIYGAFQLMLGSVSSEKNKGKDAIKRGIIGFVVSASSWLLMRMVIGNLIK